MNTQLFARHIMSKCYCIQFFRWFYYLSQLLFLKWIRINIAKRVIHDCKLEWASFSIQRGLCVLPNSLIFGLLKMWLWGSGHGAFVYPPFQFSTTMTGKCTKGHKRTCSWERICWSYIFACAHTSTLGYLFCLWIGSQVYWEIIQLLWLWISSFQGSGGFTF